MRKRNIVFISGLIICILLIGIYLKINACKRLLIKQIPLQGYSNFIIGQSTKKNELLITNLKFDKKDSVYSKIITLNNKLLCTGYGYGNFIDDSLMLVFDFSNKPFIYNVKSKTVKPYESKLDFKDKAYNDINVQSYLGEMGVILKEDNYIAFEGVNNKKLYKIFESKQLKGKYTSLVSFDVLGNNIIVCLEKKTETEGSSDYEFFLIKGKKSVKINTLYGKKTLTCDPTVKFIDDKKYIISYFDDKSILQLNSIEEASKTKRWCIDQSKILSIAYLNQVIYLTIKKETPGVTELNGNNLYMTLYKGVNVYKVTNDISLSN